MQKYKKTDVNYHYMPKCCATCKYSEYNTYDDKICRLMVATDCVIDAGAVCDKWESE